MRMGMSPVAACAMVCLCAPSAVAQSAPWTLPEILARAREQAPQIVSARLALDETRARLTGASLWLPSNPDVDTSLGNRDGAGGSFTDYSVGVSQAFEPAGRRSARMASANAAIAQGAASVDDVTRSVLRAAAAAYFRAAHAAGRIRLLDRASDLATSAHAIAERRFTAGDIAILDVNLAKASLARTRAERAAAEAEKALAVGELRQLLRTDVEIGDASLPSPATADLAMALQAASQRPDVRALQSAIQEADADLRLGESLARPDYAVGVRYAREEGDRLVLGGLNVTLPLFSRGQGERAVATARRARLRAELDAAIARAQLDVRTAFDALSRRVAAVRALEADALGSLDENERLTTRSFDVGQIGLPELLLIRRETLDTRFQHLDMLLEAALARIDLDASAGILR